MGRRALRAAGIAAGAASSAKQQSSSTASRSLPASMARALALTAGSALALYGCWIVVKKLKRVVDPTLVDPSCPLGNCGVVPQPIIEALQRIERSEHRDPFASTGGGTGKSTAVVEGSTPPVRGANRRPATQRNPPPHPQQQHVVPLEFPLPTVLVDLASFRHNVRTMARLILSSGKQIRIGTKSLRVPALIQLVADLCDAEAQSIFQDHMADRRAAATCDPRTAPSKTGFIRVDELDDEAFDVGQRTQRATNDMQSQPPAVAGLMTYSAAETLFWAKRIASAQSGARFSSLLLAYPIADAYSAHLFIDAILTNPSQRVSCSVVVDCEAQLDMLADAAIRAIRQERYLSVDGFDGTGAALEVNIMIDLDVSYRPCRWMPHLGARRSPLRNASDVTRMAQLVKSFNDKCAASMRNDRVGLRFKIDGIMGYEAQVAGLQDAPFGHEQSSLWAQAAVFVTHAFKKISMRDVVTRRQACVQAIQNHQKEQDDAVTENQLNPSRLSSHHLIVNGGGSGSLQRTVRDPTVTEVVIGSGALCGHLFDRFVSTKDDEPLTFLPAIFIAVGVNRIAEPPQSRSKMHQGVIMATQIVACHGGGYIASGSVGGGSGVGDRAPIVVYPPFGVRSVASEGFGEVQTPFIQECCIVAPGQDASAAMNNSLRSTTFASLGGFGASRSVGPTAASGSAEPSPLSMLPLTVGDVVLMRPAKSGEIAEHFDEYLLVDSTSDESAGVAVEANIVGGRHVSGAMQRVPTYRGFGSLAS